MMPKKDLVKSAKNPKIDETQINTQVQSHSQSLDEQQTPLDRFTETWSSPSQNQILLAQDWVQLTNVKDQLAQANQQTETLKRKIRDEEKSNDVMAKIINQNNNNEIEMTKRKQSSQELMSAIREKMNVLPKRLEGSKKSKTSLAQSYDNLCLEQNKIKCSVITFKNKVFNEKKGLQKEVKVKYDERLIIQTKCREVDKEVMEMNELVCNKIRTYEELSQMIENNQKQCNEQIIQVSEVTKDIETNLKVEEEEKYKLAIENNEHSKIFNDLKSKFEEEQRNVTKSEKQVEYLKPKTLNLKEIVSNLNKEICDLKNTNLALISNKDLELAKYRKQLQDLKLIDLQHMNKLNAAISDNKTLSNAVAKTDEDTEELKNTIESKDIQIKQINTKLNGVLEKNKELYMNIERLNEELITQGKQVSQNKSAFEVYTTNKDKYDKSEGELKAKLVIVQQNLNDKCDEKARLLERAINKETEFSKQMKQFERDIKQKDEQIKGSQNAAKNLQLEMEQDQLEYDREIQYATHLSTQCQLLGHDREIKENNMQIGALKRDLAAAKAEHEERSLKNDADGKENVKQETEAKRIRCAIDDLNKQYVTIQLENEGLQNKLKKAERSSKIIPTQGTSELKDSNQFVESPSQKFLPNQVTTPKPILKSAAKASPLKMQKVQFNIGSTSKIKSINPLDVFEEAERRYIQAAESYKPNFANILSISQESVTPAPVIDEARKEQTRKFFKRSRAEQKKVVSTSNTPDPYEMP
ncbi:putative leucine-rich repeat-containing protein DDB_G0290503 [Diprion similis]|uniref:putative leucine-rich repeat-containing protein DDB_G0290503 n=1 Tax=Diprion similis TaxID=362088 RepID=UPI001EF7624D|nr:putative leucine-rich repeat-containing protein DDB_G0290503 [Diprion similis]